MLQIHIKSVLGTVLFLFTNQVLQAQSTLYQTDSIQDIKIYFEQDNWDELLDNLYVAGENERLLASVQINETLLDSVGIRYKGFSSVSVDRAKNPFNIKLDYIKQQDYQGFEKIKLSNVIQDPSFVREVLSYDIARQYMPASQSNFARVFINDVYWGLYTNVEAVNKQFLGEHFGSNQNSFFKCNPEILDFDGDNSNLTNSWGTDTIAYFPYYDMRSDVGWADLYQLIDVLNENPDNIESILNVDRTLWMHAFNYTLVNFDSYIGYAQNFYLYQDDNGQFNPILWDLNQSFGSFRLADASEHFDGFSIAEAKNMDPLLHHYSVSVYQRPLMRQLFQNDKYRRMYLAHIRTIVEENFANQTYLDKAQTYQALIDADVEADVNKFYTYADFLENIHSTVSDLVEYPGISDLMDTRSTYLLAYEGIPNAPIISNINNNETNLPVTESITISATIENANNVWLSYRKSKSERFQSLQMTNNGAPNYSIEINNIGNSIQYYIYAENEKAGRFAPERAAYEFYSLTEKIQAGDLVINELMASNEATITDQAGAYEDWIELYNTSDIPISTGGLYLTDNADNIDKWALPDVSIPANGYLLIWADEDGDEGNLHANFKLSANGENLLLTYADSTIIDEVAFEEQTTDISWGRIPNGAGPFMKLSPSPNAVNILTNTDEHLQSLDFHISPNPSSGIVHLESSQAIESWEIRNLAGQVVVKNNNQQLSANVSLSAGIYFIYAAFEKGVAIQKLIIL